MALPSSLFHTILAIPYILARIEDVAMAKQLNVTLFENAFDDSELATALTQPLAHRGFDFQRLETLGQISFLLFSERISTSLLVCIVSDW